MQVIEKKFIPFLKFIRYPNLGIIILTQFLTYYFITDWYFANSIFPSGILLLITGTVFIAAGGYMINDFFDIEIDNINKPEKVQINKTFSKKFVLISYSLFNALALICALLIGSKIFFVFIFTIMLLLLYSAYFKRQFLIGNVTVSVILALTVLIVGIYCPFGNFGMLLFYSIFAFLSSFIREIVKDMEDIEGDIELKCNTIPIVAGIKTTQYFVLSLILLLICLIEYSGFYFNNISIIRIIFLNLFTVLPLIIIGYRMIRANDKKNISIISKLMKFVMLAGILSMLTIKINYPI